MQVQEFCLLLKLQDRKDTQAAHYKENNGQNADSLLTILSYSYFILNFGHNFSEKCISALAEKLMR